MKRFILIIMAGALLGVCCGENSDMPLNPGPERVEERYLLSPLDTLRLRTDSYGQYIWQYQREFDSRIVREIDRYYFSEPDDSGMVGVPTREMFVFHALAPGKTTAHFYYFGRGRSGQVVRIRIIHLAVRP